MQEVVITQSCLKITQSKDILCGLPIVNSTSAFFKQHIVIFGFLYKNTYIVKHCIGGEA